MRGGDDDDDDDYIDYDDDSVDDGLTSVSCVEVLS